MHIEVKSENAFARKVLVRVPADRVTQEIERYYTRIGQSARIPGFRPGRAPRKVLEQRYKEQVEGDVSQSLINNAWTSALKSHALQPVSQPRVTDSSAIATGKEFSFTIVLDVRPSVDAQNYTGLEVAWPASDVDDAAVEAALTNRRRGLTRLAEVQGRAAQKGDVVQVAIKATEGGELVFEAPGTLLRTESDAWLAGLEDFVVGMSVNDEKSGEVAFASTARTAAVAGKTLQVTVTALSLQSYVVPELNEALAVELGHADVPALRAATQAQLAKGRAEMARNQARANLLQALINANPFEVPSSMIEENLKLLMEELRMQQAYQGRDPRTLQFNDAMVADLRMRAGFAAKGALLLESIARKEAMEVSSDDVEAKILEIAESRGQSVEAVRAHFSKPDELADLRDRILEEKTLDWILGQAKVTHETATPAAPAVEAAPAPAKKKAAKKADAAAEPAAEPAAEAPAVEAAAEEAPKKKRASKKAEAVEAAEAAPVVEEAPAAEAPKKKRAAKKASSDE